MAEVATVGKTVQVEDTRVAVNFSTIINQIATRLQVSHFLSYGYGTKWLMRYFKVPHACRVQTFIPEKDTAAIPAQFVACLDVLGYDDEALVLPDLQRVTEAVLFANVRTTKEKPVIWWLEKFNELFDLHNFQVTQTDEFYVICYAKPKLVHTDKL